MKFKEGTNVRNELIKCARRSSTIRIMYMDDSGNVTKRTVKVLKINNSTFKAFCYLRGSRRTFKIDNLLAVVSVNNERAVV